MSKAWKKSCLGTLILLAAFSLSACTPTERQVTEKAEETEALEKWKDKMPKDMPERIALKLSEGVEVDAFLEVSGELTDWKTEPLVITRHLFDEKKCLDDLLELVGNPKVKKREHLIREDTLEDGTPLTYENADLDNDGFVQARNLYFLGNFPEKRKALHGEKFITEPDTTFDKVEKNKKLSFGGYEKVCQNIEGFLEKQDVKNILKPIIYSFTPELLQEYADKAYQEAVSAGLEEEAQVFHINYAEDEGEYLIRYTQGYHGIPYDYLGAVNCEVDGVSYARGTELSVFYGKQGITELTSSCFFDIRQVGEEQKILSLYEILKKFRDSHKREADKMIHIKQIGLDILTDVVYSFRYGILSVVAVLVSVFIPDVFITMVAPIVIYYVYLNITGWFACPSFLDITQMTSAVYYVDDFTSAQLWKDLEKAVCFSLTVVYTMSCAIIKKMKWRVEHG